MKNVLHGRHRGVLAFALLATLVSCTSAVAASRVTRRDAHRAATESMKRHHRPHGGRRGPRGPRGLPGPAGPGGSPGTGTPYSFALKTNTQTGIVFNSNGVQIEAGCIAGALELTVRPEGGDHNIVEVTSFDNSEGGKVRGASYPEAAINQPIDMLVGGSGLHDYNGLLAVRTLAGQMTTIQWWAMGSSNASQGDCVGGGTVSP